MANAPYTPPPAPIAPAPVPTTLHYDDVPSTGVRKVLDAYEERDLQRIRWGAVVAGLFIAIGTQVLLGLLGVAIGLTAVDPNAPAPLRGFGLGAGIWMALSALIGLFVGGAAAAKLGGAIRRRDGALAGLLTWATSLVVALWLVGVGASSALSGVVGFGQIAEARVRGVDTQQAQQQAERAARDLERRARAGADDAARGAWFAFGGACVSLIAAVAGGAAGATGSLLRRRTARERDRDAARKAREIDHENMYRETIKR